MSWSKSKAIERVKKNEADIPDITVSSLKREMNLENVRLGQPKLIEGAHLYSAIEDEATGITDHLDPTDSDAARSAIRAVHLWQRELSRVVSGDFHAAKIHFQGTRLHVLTYRPCGDTAEIAGRAVALAQALALTTEQAFNDVLGMEAGFVLAAGASFGQTLATRSGSRGDSELLFLGDAANEGAKALKVGVPLRATADLVERLDDDLGVTTKQMADGYWRVSMSATAVKETAQRYGIAWSLEGCRERIKGDLDKTPLDKVSVSKATASIDKDRLGLSNNKFNEATSSFGDVDGFTAIVEAAEAEDEKAELLRLFHVMRSELRHVTVQDFDTLRIQYQGDRIQALRHLPHDDEESRVVAAVELAAAWQSTMSESLPAVIDTRNLTLAIGLDTGPTLVSKLGEHGNRDMICLGPNVREAAAIQARLDGEEIGLSEDLHAVLPERLARLFAWDSDKRCYLVKGLRYNDFVLAEEASALDEGTFSMGGIAGGQTRVPERRWSR